nr:hypothetical protein [Angustibacter aerolatus]
MTGPASLDRPRVAGRRAAVGAAAPGRTRRRAHRPDHAAARAHLGDHPAHPDDGRGVLVQGERPRAGVRGQAAAGAAPARAGRGRRAGGGRPRPPPGAAAGRR